MIDLLIAAVIRAALKGSRLHREEQKQEKASYIETVRLRILLISTMICATRKKDC